MREVLARNAMLEEENRHLRWIMAILLKKSGPVVITPVELAEADADEALEMEQNADKSWSIRCREAVEVELDDTVKYGLDVRISDEKLEEGW